MKVRMDGIDAEQLELKGFSRSVAELEWLLLILMLLYLVTVGVSDEGLTVVVTAMVLFAGFVLTFRYSNFYTSETRLKLAIEIHVMVAVITVLLWHTGKIDSPLLNLYLLVIIASAITLGKAITLLELTLITSCYLYMGYAALGEGLFTAQAFTRIMVNFAPFVLVAYLTTMLAADLHFLKKVFKHRAESDDLTGLVNARGLKRILEEELARAERYERPLALMVIDADSMKSVNDRFGHTAGDDLIKRLATEIGEHLRESDVLARYGGDEFVAVLPETTAEDAALLARRVSKRAARAHMRIGSEIFKTTVSVGIADYPHDARTAEHLFARADEALYKSKAAGRNRVTLYAHPDGEEEGDSAVVKVLDRVSAL